MQVAVIMARHKPLPHKRLHLMPRLNWILLIQPPCSNQLIPPAQGIIMKLSSSNLDSLSIGVVLAVENELNLLLPLEISVWINLAMEGRNFNLQTSKLITVRSSPITITMISPSIISR